MEEGGLQALVDLFKIKLDKKHSKSRLEMLEAASGVLWYENFSHNSKATRKLCTEENICSALIKLEAIKYLVHIVENIFTPLLVQNVTLCEPNLTSCRLQVFSC